VFAERVADDTSNLVIECRKEHASVNHWGQDALILGSVEKGSPDIPKKPDFVRTPRPRARLVSR
jgi:hypothetical protein